MWNWVAIGSMAQVGTVVVGVGPIWWSLRKLRREMWLASFCHFTERYAKIADGLPAPARAPSANAELAAWTEADRTTLCQALRQYFNLRSE